jgi:hypothetical protein
MKQTDDRITWLLEAKTPSIVYQTRKDLLASRSSASQIRAAQARIKRTGAVPAILARQSKSGKWKIDHGYYGPKFYSTHWSMVMLVELEVDGTDRRFRKGAEYMLDATQKELQNNSDRKIPDWSCFWGNLLRYALHAGMHDDPRVVKLTDYLSRVLNDGLCACRINGAKACAWGVVRTLWGLAALPEKNRTTEADRAIRKGIGFLLEDHRLTDADYPIRPKTRVNPMWFKLSFPLFYHADILFTLRVLDELDALDHRGARPALDWLEARRGAGGRWKGSSPFRTRTWREMGAPEETDRWVTLQALRILSHAGRRV